MINTGKRGRGRLEVWDGHVHTAAFFFFFNFFISWRLITLQYCSGFCHTMKWISHGFTCVPHPHPPSHLPLHPIPLGLPSAPGPSTCLMHLTWAAAFFKIDNQQGPTLQHKQLCLVFYINVNKRIWKRRDTYICITESLSCIPETNTTWLINYTPI